MYFILHFGHYHTKNIFSHARAVPLSAALEGIVSWPTNAHESKKLAYVSFFWTVLQGEKSWGLTNTEISPLTPTVADSMRGHINKYLVWCVCLLDSCLYLCFFTETKSVSSDTYLDNNNYLLH